MSEAHKFSDANDALRFIIAGNAIFTLRSQATGTRYTYRVRKPQDTKPGKPAPLFASVLYGPDNGNDYAYVGTVHTGRLQTTAKSKVKCDDPRAKALDWTLGQLANGAIPAKLEMWHEGRCGRCARRLTDPVSIERGLGPECAGK